MTMRASSAARVQAEVSNQLGFARELLRGLPELSTRAVQGHEVTAAEE